LTEIDSYYEATPDSDRSLTANWPSGIGALVYGQTFRPSLNYTLTSCKFNIKRGSIALTGNLKAYLYAHTGTFGSGGIPTGSSLDTSNSLDMSTITTSYVLYTFTFSGGHSLVSNTSYCLVVYSTDSNMSGSASCKIGAMSIGAHEGNGIRYLSVFGVFEAYSTTDVMFYVYGNLILPIIKTLPNLGIYGLDDTNEVYSKTKVDATGILQTS